VTIAPTAIAFLTDAGDLRWEGQEVQVSFSETDIAAFRGPRPAIRKVGDWTVCSARCDASVVLLHFFGVGHEGASPLDLIQETETAAKARTAAAQTGDAASIYLDAFSVAMTSKRSKRLQHFVDELFDAAFARDVMAVRLGSGKVRKILNTHPRQNAVHDELRLWVKSHWRDTEAEDDMDLRLMAEKLEGKRMDVFWPKEENGRVAFVTVDANAATRAVVTRHQAVTEQLGGGKLTKTLFTRSRLLIGGALAFIALAVFLMQPVAIEVSNKAETRAAEARVLSAPLAAFVDQTMVRAGDQVRAGDTLALLRSPDIDSSIAEQRLTQNLELINAQEALDQGNFAEYQLAEQRQKIAEARLAQLETRADWLTIRSPVDGRVVNAIPTGEIGNFLALGASIAEVQPEAKFNLTVTVAETDALWLAVGQEGLVYFSGLNDRTYRLKTLTTPVRTVDEASGQASLVLQAQILDPDQGDLLVGLSGYTRIETGEGTRLYGLVRPAISYVRLALWKHLGLDI